MDDGAARAIEMFAQHRGDGIFGLAAMDDGRQSETAGKLELTREDIALDVARREIVMVVEADLADCDDTLYACERFEPPEIARSFCFVWMHADRGDDARVARRKIQRCPARRLILAC